MQTIDRCRSAHTELREMIGDLRPLLTTEKLRNLNNARDTYDLICDLRERLLRHFDDENRRLYPGLLIHGDPQVKSLAWSFISSESPLRMMFDNYHQDWLKSGDYNFCDSFVFETQQVCDLITMRLDHEEQVLFPHAVDISRQSGR